MSPTFTELVSRDNPRIRLLSALANDPKARREHGQTILDGVHLLESALAAKIPLLEVCVSMSGCKIEKNSAWITRLPAEVPLVRVPDTVFSGMSPVDTPTGIVARIQIPPPAPVVAEQGEATIVVLDAIQDPGNVGSILRSTAAAGIGTIWLTPGCAQVWAPKVLRAGIGAHFRLQLAEQVDVLAILDGYKGKVMATGLGAETRLLYDADLRGPLVWLFGAEGQGVSPALMTRADEILTIPLADGIESLNVGAAAAVCLFEQMRQRH